MDSRFNGFDKIMQTLGLGTTKSLEVWYNKFLQGKETMGLNIEGFTWDNPQVDFNWEMGEVDENIAAMATYVDLNSEPLPRGRQIQIRKFGGYIPRMKRLETQGENDYRRWLIAAQQMEGAAILRGDSPYNSILDYFAKNILATVSQLPESHVQSLTYQTGQIKSNPDGLVLTNVNNPSGIGSEEPAGIKFSSGIPAENVKTTYYWTEAADGSVESYDETKNPFKDSQDFVKKLKYDGSYGAVTLEIDEEDAFYKLVRHPAFLKAIGYMTIGGLYTAGKTNAESDARAVEAGSWALLTSEEGTVKGWFKRLMGVDDVIYHNNVVSVATLNPSTKQFDYPLLKAFNTGVMLYRPSGNIGVIKNVVPVRPDGSAISAQIFGGRGILEYRYNPETRVQTWVTELTALAVLNRPTKNYIFKIGDDTKVSKLISAPQGLAVNLEAATTTSKKSSKSTL